jgi:arylsulfatase A-like enzyme
MYLAPTTPHAPLQAPLKYIELYKGISSINHDVVDELRVLVCAMVAAMDQMVSDVLDALEAKNMLENTLIFYLSDNGGVTNFGSSNLGYSGKKGSFFEGGVRVPSFVSGNPISSSSELCGSTYDGMVHVTDLFATICTIAGMWNCIINNYKLLVLMITK